MGNRIGIKVIDKYGDGSDVVIHSHYMGRALLVYAQKFMNEMRDNEAFMEDDCGGVGRIIMCFISWIAMGEIPNDITIEDNEDDCEDNGIFTMDFREMTVA